VTLEPKPGLVVRYDFLWKEDEQLGKHHGKDRPCAIVVTLSVGPNGMREVALCAITHSAPGKDEQAVPISPRLASHLGLDEQPCWIKTEQVNWVAWPKHQLPYGISRVEPGRWIYGQLPLELTRKVFQQVSERVKHGLLKQIRC